MLRPADALHGGGIDPELSVDLTQAQVCSWPKWTTHPLFLASQFLNHTSTLGRGFRFQVPGIVRGRALAFT
jgi:hypothetical protein